MKNATVKYLKAKIKAVKEVSDEHFNAVVYSTQMAKESADKRLDGMNEFRSSLKDQQATFVPRAEYEAQACKLDTDIQDLKRFKAVHEGKATMASVYVAYIMAAISFIMSIIMHFI